MIKRRNNKQVMTLAILLVAVVGLSVGFAAFSNILTISSGATVKPNTNTFNVDFSSTEFGVATNPITPDPYGGATGTAATINNTTNPTLENLNATFTEPGQSVTYSLYAYNAGEYDAYLTSVNFNNISGEDSFIKCTPAAGTTAALVEEACKGLDVTVDVNGAIFYETNPLVTDHLLGKEWSESIYVTIGYYGSARADGEFSVEFGDITLTYSTVDNQTCLDTMTSSQFAIYLSRDMANEDFINKSNAKGCSISDSIDTYYYIIYDHVGISWRTWMNNYHSEDDPFYIENDVIKYSGNDSWGLVDEAGNFVSPDDTITSQIYSFNI